MKWRFIDGGAAPGPRHMAVDQAVMETVEAGEAPPTLRLYRWNPPCLTLGYFQKAERDVNFESCKKLSIDVTRRLTGGRAVLHQHELCYSLVLPRRLEGLDESVTVSYRQLSRGLAEGFALLGLPVVMVKPLAHEGRHSGGACFDALSAYELAAEGKKIVGSAQARRGGALLQHGSILNDLDVDTLFATMRDDDPARLQRAKETFLEKATSIRHLIGRPLPEEELYRAFKAGFELALGRDFGAEFEPGNLTPEENIRALHLEETVYRSSDWIRRR